eukprot:3194486-Prymnesium_polylepis.1
MFLRTMFSQLKWCENPEIFPSELNACADPNQQVTPSSATRRAALRFATELGVSFLSSDKF